MLACKESIPWASRRRTVEGEPAREVIIKLGKPRPEADPSGWLRSYLIGRARLD